MSSLWLTTALSVIAVLFVAVILGTIALGATAWLLARGLELLLDSDAPARPTPEQPLTCRSARGCDRQQNSWMLSA